MRCISALCTATAVRTTRHALDEDRTSGSDLHEHTGSRRSVTLDHLSKAEIMGPPLTKSDNRFSPLDNAETDSDSGSRRDQLQTEPNEHFERNEWYMKWKREQLHADSDSESGSSEDQLLNEPGGVHVRYKRYLEEKMDRAPLRKVSKSLKESWQNVCRALEQAVEERPYATLCATCESIFHPARTKLWFEMGKWYLHHRSQSALEDAVRMGCAICKIINDNTCAQAGNYTNTPGTEGTPEGHRGVLKYNIDWSDLLDYSIRIGYVPKGARFPPEEQVVLDLVMVKPESLLTINSNFESALPKSVFPSTTASTQVWDLCRYWLYSCRAGHKNCGHRRQDLSFRPSRLVHVQGMKGNIIQARLESDTKMLDAVNYLTLSHCWGSGKFFTLRKDNLEQLQKTIVVKDLSKVFQDALLATLELGFSYIWIDSLCIIQDSEEDWLRESSRMGEIYKNSSCNIAATGFSDGSRGLYVERDVSRLTCHKVSAGWGGVWPHTDEPLKRDYYPVNPRMWHDQVSKAPLNRRGWVLQERLLSPCVLNFGAEQVLWECFESSSCEAFPTEFPDCIV
ncbi:HET-domain-containing protein [Westerdykella ornata]|uniref:HET-domain-containing protein n=1 Tax=Westerdykella ornata TaxID=318751 RepID=A0A6A6J9G6_WESOR|nr:HET-domain-containing protein [Westerdykella ornata]KAF2273032.1 HET-domain-containing protein [Westerdykella ornata]